MHQPDRRTPVEAARDAEPLGLVAAMDAGVYTTDAEGRLVLANPAALRLLSRSLEDLVGRNVHELVHDRRPDGTPLPADDCPLLAVITMGVPARSDDDVFWCPDGGALPVSWVSAPLLEAGRVTGAVVVFTDATARHVEAERLAAQHRAVVQTQERLAAAHARLALLDRLSEALATLDVDDAVHRLARLTVGRTADACVVHTVQGEQVRRLAVARADHDDAPADTGPLPPLTAGSRGPLARALRTGAQQVVQRGPDDRAEDPLDAAQLQQLDLLGGAHALVTPLGTRSEVFGAMTWVRRDPGAPFDDDDRQLATEVGRRAGTALENARVHARQRSAAEALQRSLLPALPPLPGLTVVGRYLPATTGVEVGGDWFDAFRLADGSTSVVIGDILGHDLAAAAHMGQVRNLLRGIAADRPEPPSRVLARLDGALELLQVDTLATCLLARLGEPADDGRRHLQWTSAGHLPPARTSASGTVGLLDEPGDLMLGVAPSLPRTDSTTVLEAGDTVWLYTDGLVERSDQPLDAGLARLRRALTAVGHLPLEQACDALLERMLPTGHPDDVAVLAVRTAG